MMTLATLRGWAGARLAKRLPVRWVRWLTMGTDPVISMVFLCARVKGPKFAQPTPEQF
jgi:hypothetical protein